MDFWIDLLGALGILSAVLAFQCKKHGRVLTYRTANEIFFGVQFFLLGAYTGVAMNVVGSIRNTIFTLQVKKGRSTRWSAALFCLAFLVFGLLTWEGPKSILVIAAKIISTLAFGNKNLLVVRLLILVTSSSWLIYDLFSGSYAGVVCEILTLLSILIALYRFHIPHKKKEA
jgi:hypothetical protein